MHIEVGGRGAVPWATDGERCQVRAVGWGASAWWAVGCAEGGTGRPDLQRAQQCTAGREA